MILENSFFFFCLKNARIKRVKSLKIKIKL